MPVKKLKDFLDKNNVKYVTITHSKAYTAQGVASSAHVSGKDLANTVMVQLDGKMAMAVLPASEMIDVEHLKEVTGAKEAWLASESEFKDAFPGCEVGAMPPFGNLYGMEVYVDDSLGQREEISFNAGSHTELIRLGYRDFERLVKPKVMEFAYRH
jgi:Ala-tRNA(Pro) deacylase